MLLFHTNLPIKFNFKHPIFINISEWVTLVGEKRVAQWAEGRLKEAGGKKNADLFKIQKFNENFWSFRSVDWRQSIEAESLN